jgi:hypothetical protein
MKNEPYQEKIDRVKIVVHTASGKTFESMVMDMSQEESGKWAEMLRTPKDWVTFYIPLVHALGWQQHIFFNPAFIVGVEVIVVPDKPE